MSILSLLLSVLVVGLIVRYPTSGQLHEAGADGSYYAALASMINEYGRAPWAVNSASYFGLYPYSEASAVPFAISGFGSVAGLPEIMCVVLVADVAALAGALGVFVCIVRITRSGLAGIVGTLAFLTAPILLLYSSETLVARFYVTCWVPFVMVVFLERRKWGRARTFIVGLPLFLLLAATHLSFVLTSALFFGIWILQMIEGTWRRIRMSLIRLKPIAILSKWYYAAFVASCALLVLVSGIVLNTSGSQGSALGTYEIGVFPGGSPVASYGNLVAATVGGAGIIGAALALFAPKLWTFGRRPFTFPALGALLLVFALVNFRLYSRPLIAALAAIAAGLGFVVVMKMDVFGRRPRLKRVFGGAIVVFLVAGTGISLVIEERWASAEASPASQAATAVFVYVRTVPPGNLFCNYYPTDRFLTAYSGRFCSPDLPGSALEMVPFITSQAQWSSLRLRPRSLVEILSSSDLTLYAVDNYDPYSAYFQMAQNPLASNSALAQRYDVRYALENRAFLNEYRIRWNVDAPTGSAFLASLRSETYLIYQDDQYNLWSI